MKLNYLDWGGQGPTLILIHGYGDNPHAFDDTAPAFAEKFRVIAYARRAHGLSEAKPPYDLVTLTEDLRGLMDQLGIPKAHLAGWSMGGDEATSLASAYPERVDRIVYLDAGYDWADPESLAAMKAFPLSPAPPAEALGSIDAFRKYYSEAWMPGVTDVGRVEAYIRELVVATENGPVRLRMGASEASELWKVLLSEHKDYARIRSPVLAIYARTFYDLQRGDPDRRRKLRAWEEEFVVPLRRTAIERIRRELTDVEVLTVNGTHTDFVYTSRSGVTSAMNRFLSAARTTRERARPKLQGKSS